MQKELISRGKNIEKLNKEKEPITHPSREQRSKNHKEKTFSKQLFVFRWAWSEDTKNDTFGRRKTQLLSKMYN